MLADGGEAGLHSRGEAGVACQDVVECLADLAILLGRAGGVRGKGFFEGCMRACGAAEIGRTRETA